MPPKKQLAFKEAFAELEKIADRFESEEVDVETGLKDFERGLELARLCKTTLRDLEVRVKEIQEKLL